MPNDASPKPKPRAKKPRIWRIRDGARRACRRLVRERDEARAELADLRGRADTIPPPTEAAPSSPIPAEFESALEALHRWLAWVAYDYCAGNKPAEHALMCVIPGTPDHQTAKAAGHVSGLGIPSARILDSKPARETIVANLLSMRAGSSDWKRLAIDAIGAYEPGQLPLQMELAAMRDQVDTYRRIVGAIRENLEDADPQ